jgi:hypothetical protein
MVAALRAEPRYSPRADELESLDTHLLTLTHSAAPSAAPSPASRAAQ